MSKKKNCRRTPEEQALHREAVRLRNMTDKQLVEEFHRAAEPGMAHSVPQSPQVVPEAGEATDNTPAVQRLLEALADGKCKGIKSGIAYKVAQLAAEMGLV